MALHLTETKPFMAFSNPEVTTMTVKTTHTHKTSNRERTKQTPTTEVEGYRFLEFENLPENSTQEEKIDMTELKEGTYNFLGLRNRPEDSQTESFTKLSNHHSTTPKAETSNTDGYQLLGIEETATTPTTPDSETDYEPQEGTYQLLGLR